MCVCSSVSPVILGQIGGRCRTEGNSEEKAFAAFCSRSRDRMTGLYCELHCPLVIMVTVPDYYGKYFMNTMYIPGYGRLMANGD